AGQDRPRLPVGGLEGRRVGHVDQSHLEHHGRDPRAGGPGVRSPGHRAL
ncbi:MAG: hypothetical protein AVDCRST_MAG48-3071, partial [uncultured Friedmanniella sp.]